MKTTTELYSLATRGTRTRNSYPYRQSVCQVVPVKLAIACLAVYLTVHAFGAADFIYSNKFDNVSAEVWLPGDAPVVRGMIVHAANYQLNPDDRWAEFGRSIGFGHVTWNMDNVHSAGNRGPRLRAALDKVLRECAEKTGRQELLYVPFVGTGHSAGGLVTPTLLTTLERVITLTIDCGWVSDHTKFKPEVKQVPQLFTLGAIPDDYKMLPGIESRFVPTRADGWLWALGLQRGCAHDFRQRRHAANRLDG